MAIKPNLPASPFCGFLPKTRKVSDTDLKRISSITALLDRISGFNSWGRVNTL